MAAQLFRQAGVHLTKDDLTAKEASMSEVRKTSIPDSPFAMMGCCIDIKPSEDQLRKSRPSQAEARDFARSVAGTGSPSCYGSWG